MAPVLGQLLPSFARQARAVWQWVNFLHGSTQPGEKCVVVNFDETSIRLFQDAKRGFLVRAARVQKQAAKSLARDAAKGQLRGTFSFVAMICDEEQIQPLLPQHIFMTTSQISEVNLEAVKATMLPNMHVHRSESAWTTVDKMKVLFKTLADAIRRCQGKWRVILMADTYKAHISKGVWASAAAHGIFYCLVPAKMTWCLQPCDTHLFASFKHHLSLACQRRALRNAGKLDIFLVLDALKDTVRLLLNRKCWRRAFADLGYRGTQHAISAKCLERLELAAAPAMSNDIPSLQQLTACFPKGSDIPIGHVFSAVVRAEHLAVLSGAAAAVQSVPHSSSLPALVGSASSTTSTAPPAGVLVLQPLAEPPVAQLPAFRLQPPRLSRLPSASRLEVQQPLSRPAVRPPLPPPAAEPDAM